jgi:hypothetical protein
VRNNTPAVWRTLSQPERPPKGRRSARPIHKRSWRERLGDQSAIGCPALPGGHRCRRSMVGDSVHLTDRRPTAGQQCSPAGPASCNWGDVHDSPRQPSSRRAIWLDIRVPCGACVRHQAVASRSTFHLVAIMAFWRSVRNRRVASMPPERGHGRPTKCLARTSNSTSLSTASRPPSAAAPA